MGIYHTLSFNGSTIDIFPDIGCSGGFLMGLIEVSQNVPESLSTTEEQKRRLNAERRAEIEDLFR